MANPIIDYLKRGLTSGLTEDVLEGVSKKGRQRLLQSIDNTFQNLRPNEINLIEKRFSLNQGTQALDSYIDDTINFIKNNASESDEIAKDFKWGLFDYRPIEQGTVRPMRSPSSMRNGFDPFSSRKDFYKKRDEYVLSGKFTQDFNEHIGTEEYRKAAANFGHETDAQYQDHIKKITKQHNNYVQQYKNRLASNQTSIVAENVVDNTPPVDNIPANTIAPEVVANGQNNATDMTKRSHSRKARNLEKYNRDSTYIPKKPELDAQAAAIQNEAMTKDYENLMGEEEPAMQHSRKAQQAERFNKQLSEIKEETKRYSESRKYYNKPKPETGTEANASFGSVGRAALGTAVGGAALMAALSGSRGQQNNAQLYGQQPLY